jgi:outer membrane receptor protein involved in Fe transport
MNDANHAGARGGPQALSAAISTILAVAGGNAAAQDQAQPPPVTGLGEVIVTATKRAESLQNISESITAFNSEAIAMRGLQEIDDIAKYIPGLSLAQREPAGTTIVFRGVASSGIEFGGVSSSALYLDEQPITQSGRNPDPRFIDIERIEALRGPQGTLYGASSQSGTLRVITNKPDPGAFDAWVDSEVSDTQDGGVGYDLSAMANIPLASDRLALRLVGFTTRDAGFIDNVLSDSQGGTFDNSDVADKDVNQTETNGARAALRWDISDNVDLTLGLLYQDVHADGHGDVTATAGDLNQVRFEKESLDDEWYQASLTLNASMGFADLVVAASYFDRKFAYEADASDYEFQFNQAAIYYNTAIYDFGGDPRGFATNHERTFITTVEARLQSSHDAESRWSWLAGAFYSRETGHTNFDSYVRGYADTPAFAYFDYYEQQVLHNPPLAPTDKWFLGVYDPELEQQAVFGELGFDVTDRFTITAGGRWFNYDRRFQQHQESPEGFSGGTVLNADEKSTEDGTVWKLNLQYQIDDDRMVYATYSEGFRVGGSNPLKPASILPRIYLSDTLKNYEIGAKTEWLQNRMRFNISAYTMDWDNFAVQIEDPQDDQDGDAGPIPAVFQLGYVNLPSAKIEGVESELSFVVSDAWQVDASLGWNNGEVAQATVLTLEDDLGNQFPVPVAKGARLPLTPDWQASLGLEWRPRGQLLNAQPFARLDLAYVGEVVTSLEGIQSVVSAGGAETIDAYQTGDFRIGLEGERWSGSLFVDNVWDERATLFLSNRWGSSGGPPDTAHASQRLTINRPRTIGLQFRYEF